MSRGQILKILVILLTISIMLSVAVAIVEDSSTGSKLVGTSVNVLPAKVDWARTYGAVGDDDRAYCALPVGNGYLVVGSSQSNKTLVTVGWAVNLDQNGNPVWNQTFLVGSGTEIRYAANLTDGFFLVGNEFLSKGYINGYVARIDKLGNLMWQTTIGGNETDEFYSAFATPDGLILLGLSSTNGGVTPQAWVVKIDTNGNIIWNKTYSFASDTIVKTGAVGPDGNYMIAGYTDPRGPNNYDFLLMKIDPNGNLAWNQTYGKTGTQEANAMTETTDGYVIAGNTQSPNGNMHALIMKVDFNGNLDWSKTIGGKNADSPAYITPAQDGGYLVCGFTFSFGAGNRDFWLFKIDESGKVLWSCTQGDVAYQEAYAVIQEGKNQYVMVGWTDPPGQPTLVGRARYLFYVVSISYP